MRLSWTAVSDTAKSTAQLNGLLEKHQSRGVHVEVWPRDAFPLDQSGAWPVEVFGVDPRRIRLSREMDALGSILERCATPPRECDDCNELALDGEDYCADCLEEHSKAPRITLDSSGEQALEDAGAGDWDCSAGRIVGVLTDTDIYERAAESFRDCFDSDPMSYVSEYDLECIRENYIENMGWDDALCYAGGEERFEEIADADERAEEEGFEKGSYVEWDV